MRLLLVEDDVRMARFMARGLREQSYAVDISPNGEDALYQVAINAYDAVILDVMIPAPDGFAVLHEMRDKGAHLPVLMLTARDAVEDRIAGLDAGADDYLTKPFEFGELLARLRALLRRGHDLQQPTLSISNLVIDTRRQQAWRDGRLISLTTKEYALLEYLARQHKRVVGREEIAEHVWDESFDPFTNLIEVYINRLRRKIDGPYAPPLIHTKRGAGYVLDALDEAETHDSAINGKD